MPKRKSPVGEKGESSARRRLVFAADEEEKSPATPSPSPSKKPKKQTIDSYLVPTTRGSAFQTPQKKTKARSSPELKPRVVTEEKKEEYVPIHIHKNLGYRRKAVAKELDEATLKVFERVEKYYHVPTDFEQDRKYGPLSGTSFEERLISAYSLNLLDPKKEQVKICSFCAGEGHKKGDCPELI